MVKKSTNYRSQDIEKHCKSAKHRELFEGEVKKYLATFTAVQTNLISLQWIKMMAKLGVPYSVFRNDGDLLEALAILLESQLNQPVCRKSLKLLFPSRRTMALRLPKMKKEIDGKFLNKS